jgi:hypothetical protein
MLDPNSAQAAAMAEVVRLLPMLNDDQMAKVVELAVAIMHERHPVLGEDPIGY